MTVIFKSFEGLSSGCGGQIVADKSKEMLFFIKSFCKDVGIHVRFGAKIKSVLIQIIKAFCTH